MKITVLSKSEARSYKPIGTAIIIRIGDYFPSRIPLGEIQGKYLNITEYDFPDIDEFTEYSMKDEEAKSIAATIKEYSGEVEEIVVHCIYGQGRSPAIAYAIATYNNDTSINYPEQYEKLNNIIYDKLMKYL